MKGHATRGFFFLLFACGWSAAQTGKGQQAANPAPSGATQQQIPAQLYLLGQLPITRTDAEANLVNRWWDHKQPHYIWYRVYESKSVAIPLVLAPMTCGQKPEEWRPRNPGDTAGLDPYVVANYDDRFVRACAGADRDAATPSQPSQNRNPLKLGDGLIIAIYDPESLLERFDVREIGLTIQTSNGTVLNTDPVRPSFSASGGSAPSGGGAPSTGGPGGVNYSYNVESPNLKKALNKILESTPKNEREGVKRNTLSQPAKPQPHPQFRYIAWAANPLLGDVVLNVTITTQGPAPVPLTVRTDPSGGTITINGAVPPSPTVTFPSGTVVTAEALTNPGYSFVRWSDGATSVKDTIAIGSNPITVTAEYVDETYPVPVTVVVNPAGLIFASGAVSAAGCSGGTTVWMCHPPPPPGNITVSAPAYGSLNGYQYRLQNWSSGGSCDGGATSCQISLGKEPVVLVANYAKGLPANPPLSLAAVLTGGAGLTGLLARAGGNGYILPQAVQAATGDILNIDVPAQQQIGPMRYDSGVWVPSFVDPYTILPGRTTLTANFTATTVGPPAAGDSQLTIKTVPGGLFVSRPISAGNEVFLKDGSAVTGPVGTIFSLDASLPQYQNGMLYKFQSWSDGVSGAQRVFTLTDAPGNLTATFSAVAAATTTIPVTVTTDPPNLQFSVNGISQRSSGVMYFSPGASVALNTSAVQSSLAGVQYTFSGWSDAGGGNAAAGGGSASTAHNFTIPNGQQAGGQQQQQTGGNVGGNTGGNQASQNPPLSASVTAVFTQSAPGPTEQSMTLLNTNYPQTHNLSRFNIASGLAVTYLGKSSPSWSRVETSPAVTCGAGVPQPCIPSPALYQTVENQPNTLAYDPVLFFMVYPFRLDSERKWHPRDFLHPALDFGLSLSSPSTDFFVAVSEEAFVRGVQFTGGVHVGQVNELSPTAGVNDPTSSAAPVTITRWHGFLFGGLTFNLNFIQTLFGGGKGGG